MPELHLNFLRQLLENSRLLTVLYDNLPEEIKTSNLYTDITDYLVKYTSFNNITTDKAIMIYTNYINTYDKHCKHFKKSGKYPIEIFGDKFLISREEYDVILLFSVLFTVHRFRIMKLLRLQSATGKALFIGLGPGLELLLSKEKYSEIHAYDLSVNKFLFSEFSQVFLKTELYTGQYENYFDSIYMIELLEHLKDPYILLKTCYKSLRKGGRIFFTTATNIPQFDHLYNFPKDHSMFESELKKLGLAVLYREWIPHNYLTMGLNSSNHFYVTEKK